MNAHGNLSVGEVLAKVRRIPSPPWLETPPYKGFLKALNPETKQVDDEFQENLWNYVHLNESLSHPVHMALSYHKSQQIKMSLNAMFFGGAEIKETVEATGLTSDSVEAYRSLFCDLSVFNGSRLLLIDFVEQFPETTDSDKEEKELYQLAINYGWEWVQWKITRGLSGHIPGNKIVDVLINMSFWKAMEASDAPLGSTAAKEGRHYLKQAADLALDKHRSKMGTLNSVKELEIRLTSESEDDFQELISQSVPPAIEELLYKQEKD